MDCVEISTWMYVDVYNKVDSLATFHTPPSFSTFINGELILLSH